MRARTAQSFYAGARGAAADSIRGLFIETKKKKKRQPGNYILIIQPGALHLSRLLITRLSARELRARDVALGDDTVMERARKRGIYSRGERGLMRVLVASADIRVLFRCAAEIEVLSRSETRETLRGSASRLVDFAGVQKRQCGYLCDF